MPRPAGAPFWGEARGPNDYAQLGGVSDYWDTDDATMVLGNAFSIGALQFWGEGDTGTYYDDYMVPHDGWSGVVLTYSGGTYLEPSDTGLTTTWVVRARGTGTITASDDLDPTWDYSLPGNSLGTQTVSGSAWALYSFPTGTYDVADLMGSAAQRLGLQVTGSIEIDVVQLRIWPAMGAVGGWAPAPAEDTTKILTTTQLLVGHDGALGSNTSAGSTTYGTYPDAYASMIANIDGIEERASSPASGRGGAWTSAGDNVVSSLDGSQHQWKWAYYTGYLSCSVGNIAALSPTGYLSGVEGVDYVRRPDRVVGDLRAYWDWAGSARPSMVGWVNATGRFEGSKHAYDGNGAYDWTGSPGTVTYGFADYVKPGPVNTWVPAQVGFPPVVSGVELAVPDPGPVVQYIPVDLPLLPRFSLVMTNSFMDAMPAQPDITGASINGGSSITISGSLSLGGPNEADLVAALVRLPSYQVWTPAGAISWTRQRQRGDGFGSAPRRARVYTSIRQRGIQ